VFDARRWWARLAALVVVVCAAAASGASTASSSRYLQVGIFDEGQVLYGNTPRVFNTLDALHVEIVRANLYWGGPLGVARRRPARPTNPNDPAYSWALYDRTVMYAADHGMKVVFSIFGTPGWANGGKARNRAPTKAIDLRSFAYAAARRYSGTFERADGEVLPPVRLWMAWNEPNNPNFLTPQFRRVGKKYVVQSPIDYARICNAVVSGVHGTALADEKVACGVTGPRGNNQGASSRPSISPIVFLQGMKRAGAKGFDAYAHHPYYGRPSESPTTRPLPRTAVTLANIDTLVKEVTRLYGPKRIWLTEYGYQTRPPDSIFGVSWANQAKYLTQAFTIARKNPRIDMMLWFLLRDDPVIAGWQSGLFTAGGKRKPAYAAFQRFALSLSR
jgi:hypothetical protein